MQKDNQLSHKIHARLLPQYLFCQDQMQIPSFLLVLRAVPTKSDALSLGVFRALNRSLCFSLKHFSTSACFSGLLSLHFWAQIRACSLDFPNYSFSTYYLLLFPEREIVAHPFLYISLRIRVFPLANRLDFSCVHIHCYIVFLVFVPFYS